MGSLIKLAVLSLTALVLLTSTADALLWLPFDFGLDIAYENLRNATREKNRQLYEMAGQIMHYQYQNEERIRMEGQSGMVQVRSYYTGPKNYESDSIFGPGFMGMHDMLLMKDVLGYGEMNLVMNGVQFTSRHGDFEISQPSTTSTNWLETEPIPPPPVPESVRNAGGVQAQVDEMIEYFRAFKTSNTTHRPYTDYFKPILCYIEGYWQKETEALQEVNDLAVYRVRDYQEVMDQNRQNSLLGSVYDQSHRLPNLPRSLIGMDKEGYPVYGQWTYRYMCKPFNYSDIGLHNLVLLDNVQYRMNHGLKTSEELKGTRGARYVVKGENEGRTDKVTLLDKLVSTIPGLNNYKGQLTEKDIMNRNLTDGSETLNSAYYNRIFYDPWRDVMRANTKARGFADPFLFVAMTDQEQVAPVRINYKDPSKAELDVDLRVSYLLPVEIVYLTPLLSWNPYDITFHEGKSRTVGDSAIVRKNKVDGTSAKPFDGNNWETFAITPFEFYENKRARYISPDIGGVSYYVKDSSGVARLVSSSNTRTILSPVGGGVGNVRLRYPIMPLHEDGSYYAKEFNAYRDYVNTQLHALASKLKIQLGFDV